jgi:hypothetical protein
MNMTDRVKFAELPLLTEDSSKDGSWQPVDPDFVFYPQYDYGNEAITVIPYSEATRQELLQIIISDVTDWVPPKYRGRVDVWTVYPDLDSPDPLDHRWGVVWKYTPLLES